MSNYDLKGHPKVAYLIEGVKPLAVNFAKSGVHPHCYMEVTLGNYLVTLRAIALLDV